MFMHFYFEIWVCKNKSCNKFQDKKNKYSYFWQNKLPIMSIYLLVTFIY